MALRRCFPCESRLRNLIDRTIIEEQATGAHRSTAYLARAVWQRLPVIGFPLPSIHELITHITHEHMRSLEVIERLEADERAMAAEVLVIERGTRTGSLAVVPVAPVVKRKPRRKNRSYWSDYAMANRARRTGWTPEMQIRLREAQGNVCAWCKAGPPNHMDVEYTDLGDGSRRITVYGFLCDYCHLITKRTHRDREHLLAGIAYWDNPPARLVS